MTVIMHVMQLSSLIVHIPRCIVTVMKVASRHDIEPGYDKVYDVVVSSKVVESVARNLDEYVIYLSRLGGLVKPGGMLMMYNVENKTGFYNVGGINFRNLPVPVEFTVSTLKKAGFINVAVDKFFPDDPNRIFSFLKCERSVV